MNISGTFINHGIGLFRVPYPMHEDGSITATESGLSVCGIRPSNAVANAGLVALAIAVLIIWLQPNETGGTMACLIVPGIIVVGTVMTPTKEQRRATIEIPWKAVQKISGSGSVVRILVKGAKPSDYIQLKTSEDASGLAEQPKNIRRVSNVTHG